MATQQLLLTDPQTDYLTDAIEEAIEVSHDLTIEHEKGSEEFKYGESRLKALLAILDQIDPENPVFEADFKAGVAFDWNAFWDEMESVEEDEDGDEDEDEEDEPVAAPSPASSTKAG